MRRLRFLLVASLAAVSLAVTAPVHAADVDPFLPNDSEAIFVLNIRQLLDSNLFKKYGVAEKAVAALKEEPMAVQVLSSLGIDPLKDIDSVVIAGGTDPDKGLVIVHGHFDVAKFNATGEQHAKDHPDNLKVQKIGATTVFEVSAPELDKPMFVAAASKTTLVAAGSKDYLAEALDKAAGKKKTALKSTQFADLLGKADAKQSMWLVVGGAALQQGLAKVEQAKEVVAKIENLTGGVTLTDDVKMKFVISTKDADGAKALSKMISDGINAAKGFASLIAAQEKAAAPLLEVFDSIKVDAADKTVSITGGVSAEQIDKALKR